MTGVSVGIDSRQFRHDDDKREGFKSKKWNLSYFRQGQGHLIERPQTQAKGMGVSMASR